jgi:hypothetical protein
LLLHAKPLRCQVCYHRFYVWPWFRKFSKAPHR